MNELYENQPCQIASKEKHKQMYKKKRRVRFNTKTSILTPQEEINAMKSNQIQLKAKTKRNK